jgi:hypothetical protein
LYGRAGHLAAKNGGSRPGQGQHWHSHNYTEDEQGVTTRPGGAQLRLVRSLVYPAGFAKHNDGGLKVLRQTPTPPGPASLCPGPGR